MKDAEAESEAEIAKADKDIEEQMRIDEEKRLAKIEK